MGSYTSPYIKSKAYVALYWGYTSATARRKTARDAFKECMDDIKKQIASKKVNCRIKLNKVKLYFCDSLMASRKEANHKKEEVTEC